jgi:site-specific DNA recombinase
VQGRETTTSVTCKGCKKLPPNEQIVVKNAHPAIISRVDFEAVQRYMEGRKRQQSKPKAKKHLFTNHLYCADCGKSLWYVHYRKGYVCGNYYKYGKHVCTQHSIRESELIEVILDDLRRLSNRLNEKDIMQQLEFKVKQAKKRAEKQVQFLSRQIEKLKEKRRSS